MGWQGEELFSRMLGMRGLKCLLYFSFEQENRIRVLEGRPEITWQQAIAAIENKMSQFASDDEGADE